MTPDRFLVIEDDDTFNHLLVRSLTRRGLSAQGVHSPGEALDAMAAAPADRIILDLNLGGSSGLNLIPELRRLNADCRIVVLTGYASIATAVEAVKRGAIQYLAKPVDLDTLLKAFEDPAATPASAPPPEERLSVERLAWEHIQQVLAEHDGNISATARALKMHRRTLQRRLMKRPVKH